MTGRRLMARRGSGELPKWQLDGSKFYRLALCYLDLLLEETEGRAPECCRVEVSGLREGLEALGEGWLRSSLDFNHCDICHGFSRGGG